MAFKIKQFFNSPLNNVDENERRMLNNRRINEERQAMRSTLEAERQHVSDVRGNVKNVVNDALAGKPEYTLGRNDTIRRAKLGQTDILGGKLVKKSTFDWLEGVGTKYETSRPGCNSYACAIGGQAGMRVPQNEKGGISIYEESANGGKGGNVWYASGDPMPIVPWNARFDDRAADLGFELQPEGTRPEAGDFIRQGYDEVSYPFTNEYDEYGNPVQVGEARPGTFHSIIATDSLKDGGVGAYNRGDIYSGLRTDERGSYYTRDSNFDADTNDRIQRYVGSTPYYEQQWEDFQGDSNNKLEAMDLSHLKSDVALPEPKENLEDLLTLPKNRFDESTLSKKDLKKLNRSRNK